MKRIYLSLLVVLFTFSLINAQSVYSRISIDIDRGSLPALFSLGLPSDDGYYEDGRYIAELPEEIIGAVGQAGYDYEVLIADVSNFYEKRNLEWQGDFSRALKREADAGREWEVPEGFALGSIGGFCSIDEMLDHLDSMIAWYPDLISQVQVLDQLTHEGREIKWVKISDNPNINETGEPEILYTGMHHAREPIGMQHLLFFMYYLLENYDTDPDVQYVVDNFELYIVPVINMDGYAYNIQNYPYGGGMWRKNRRDNGGGIYGVDLNRNYGYMWGLDNYGSSPYPSEPTYRGPAAFSEPETQTIKSFCEDNEFVTALNYHSYSNLLLYPWGYTTDPTPDVDIFEIHSEIMVAENGYANKPGVELYPTNGGSDDWMYGEQGSKEKILSYTPEVGSNVDGFWPAVSRIVPLCQENMWQSLMAAKLAGAYATSRDIDPVINSQTEGTWAIEIRRIGLLDGATYNVSITPLGDAITSIGDEVAFSGLDLLQVDTAFFTYTLREDLQAGEEILYLVSVDNGMLVTSDTVTKVFGDPLIVFEDDAESLARWHSSQWDITDNFVHSGQYSITDSPYGNYANYENNNMFLLTPVDLTGAAFAILNFWARWEIESGYDFVQVYASNNEGQTWVPLEGNFTHPGNANQAQGQPLYDGFQYEWVKEEILLNDYLGENILLRFRLDSDEWTTEDGFYWDDMSVTIVDVATGIPDPEGSSSRVRWYPNPADDQVTFEFSGEARQITIHDIAGRLLLKQDIGKMQENIRIDISGWHPGIYFFRCKFSDGNIHTGKLIGK